MNKLQNIGKNMFVLLFSTITNTGLGFIYTLYTARYLGVEEFGVLSFALAFTGIFGVFTDLGLSTLTTRDVARDNSLASKYLGNIALMKVVMVMITFCLIILIINLMEYPEKTVKVVYLVTLSIIFTAFTQMFNSIFYAFEKMEYVSMSGSLNSILMICGIFIVIKMNFGVIGVSSIYSLVSLIVLGYNFVTCRRKFVLPRVKLDWKFIKDILERTLPFSLTSISLLIYYYSDKIMISVMSGDTAVGYYSAAFTLVSGLSIIPSAVVTSLFPTMSNNHKDNHKKSLCTIYNRCIKYMYVLALPIVTGTILLSEKIISNFYGIEYLPSTHALNILIWNEFFVFFSLVVGYLQIAINKESTNLYINIIGLTLNIILNLILIPKFGFTGAAIATTAVQFIYVVGGIYILSTADLKLNYSKILPIPLFANLIMGGFIYNFSEVPLYAIVPSSAILYFFILIITGGFDNIDKTIVYQIISKKRNVN